MTAVSPNGDSEDSSAKSKADAVLQAKPDYAPALMIVAASEAASGAEAQAISRYQKVLAQFPEFAPAQRELALLYAKDKARRDDAFALATQAYRALPKDAAIAQLLGELSYDRKDYRRAVQLLQESDSRKQAEPARPLLSRLGIQSQRPERKSEIGS